MLMNDFKFEKLFPADNAVFSGGFGLAILAAGASMIRSGSNVAVKLMKRHCLVTLEVTSKDKSYPWVLQWISAQGTRTQHLSAETSFKPSAGSLSNIKFDLVPGPGQHVVVYKGRIMFINRTREQQMVDLNSGKPWEKVEFMSIGRNTSIFGDLLLEAYENSARLEEGKTIIYTNWGAEWRQFGQPRKKRSLDSVILDDQLSQRLLADVQEWMASSAWYSDRGIPYRRGYLLHGPPGSGKSSFIMALAGKLGYNICVLNLAERGLTDDRLSLALSSIPPQSIVLLEDIDAAFPSRESEAAAEQSGRPQQHSSDVTFSGLLNVLDGVASSEERLVFMTTNHVDRLDPALIRPGRVDYVQIVDNASDFQVKRIFTRFYPETTEDIADQFVKELRHTMSTVSMALLQGYLLRHKEDPASALLNVSQLISGEYSYKPACSTDGKKTAPKHSASTPTAKSVRARPVTRVSAEEVDKMFFNPQEGWDREASK